MASFDVANQAAASIPTPTSGNTTLFVDTDKLLKGKDDTGAVTNYGAAGLGITSLTGEVTAAGPGAAAATLSNSAVIGKVLTGLVETVGTVSATDTLLQAFGKLVTRQNIGFYPEGVDGDVVISSDTTLVRDMYYNSLTINNGATLFPNGFRVFSKTAMVINGIVDRSGPNATGTAATTGLAAGTLSAGAAGGAGGTAAGSAGGASATSLGGAGGAGGATGSAGGAGGTNTLNTAANGGVETFLQVDRSREGRNIAGTLITTGSGGGGGAGDGTAGGAGGAGGGIIVLMSPSITGSGSIRVMGGNGFTPAAGNRGGGGGGGGGVICLLSTNDTTLTSLSLNVAGGVGASGSGTGGSGVNGTNGRIYRVRA